MHTIISDRCTGCELCLAPCPVDCIHMQPIPPLTEAEQQAKTAQYRAWHQQHQQRLAAKPEQSQLEKQTIAERQNYILQALQRTKTKDN